MNRACALAAIAVAVACRTDPTLHVDVTHPPGLAVATTTVTVYESNSFGCLDVEYDNVDDVQLQAAFVATETIEAGGATTGALAGISRTDKKIVVARGFDLTGALIAAGCVEKLVVTGADEVAIQTEVTATVSVGIADPTGADFYGVAVSTTDATGKLLDGRQVWWRVYGPAGAMPATTTNVNIVSDGVWEPTQPSCSARGIGTVHPVPPVLVSGFAIEVRVAWAVAPAPLFSAFTKADFSLAPLAPPNASVTYCARQTQGGMVRLDCLDTVTGTGMPIARQLQASVNGGTASLMTAGPPVSVAADTIAVYAVPAGANQDVYAVTARCAIQALFGSTAPTDPNPACGSGGDDAVYVPACGATPARVLVHIAGGAGRDSIKQIDPHGGALAQPDLPLAYKMGETTAQLVGAGCVTELDRSGGPPVVRQVFVVQFGHAGNPALATRVEYSCGVTCELTATELPVPGSGVGFTGGTEPRMIAATLDATGVVMSQLVLVTNAAGGDNLVERARTPAAGPPSQIVVGNFDSDTGPDLIWELAGRRVATFEVAYARTAKGQPIEALTQSQNIALDQLLVGDVTGDSFDDIVITGTDDLSGKRGVVVIPVRVPAQTTTPIADMPCAP